MPTPQSIVWLPLQNHASVRAAHDMRSWRLYWHYLTLTCRISQLSQGDRWSLPGGQGDAMTYDDLLIFLLEECNDRKSHFCHESTPDAEHDIWLRVSIFLKITLKKITLSRFHPSYPLPFLEIEDLEENKPKNDPTKCPPPKKKIRSRSLSPPSSEVEVGELGKNVTNRPRGCMEYVCICMVSSFLANGWALIFLGLHI